MTETSPRTEGTTAVRDRNRRVLDGWMIAVIVALAVALRATGIDFLLPMVREDDSHVLDQAEMLLADPAPWCKPLSREIVESAYPHALAWAVAFLRPSHVAESTGDLAVDLATAAAPIVAARWIVLLLSVALIPLYFLVVRAWFDVRVATIGAAFLATSLLHCSLSIQARPHGPFATFAFAACLAAMRYRRDPTQLNASIAGIATTLCVGFLPFGFLFMPALVVASLLNRATLGAKCRHLATMVGFIAIAVLAFYPFSAFAGGSRPLTGNHPVDSYSWRIGGLFEICRLYAMTDPIHAVLAISGIVALVFGRQASRSGSGLRRNDLAVLIAGYVPFWIMAGGKIHDQTRFFLPCLPLVASLCAIGVDRLVSTLTSFSRDPRRRTIVTVGIVSLTLIVPTLIAIKFAWLRVTPSSFDVAADWLRRNVDPASARILLGANVTLPLRSRNGSIDRATLLTGHRPWEAFQHAHPSPHESGAEWQFVRLNGVNPLNDNRLPDWRATRTSRISRLSPTHMVLTSMSWDHDHPFLPGHSKRHWTSVHKVEVAAEAIEGLQRGFSDTHLFERVWKSERWGPPLEFYEVHLGASAGR